MWSFTVGTTSGVSASQIDTAMSVVEDAAGYWGRYIDFGSEVIDITVNFVSLGETALAQAGGTFYSIGTSGGNTVFQAGSILELQDGTDLNGSEADIEIDINSDVINDGDFFFGGLSNPNVPFSQFDLFTVLLHEIAHGLGFLSFLDEGGSDISVYDLSVNQSGPNYFFTGVGAMAVYGGNVPLDAEPSHINDSTFDLLNAALYNGVRVFLSELDVAMLEDIGAPILGPTGGDDVLYGFHTGFDGFTYVGGEDNIALLGGDDWYDGLSGDDTIDGGAGDDTLIGGAGGDWLIGGANIDVASYETSASGVNVNLLSGAASGGDAAGDTLSGIEGLIGSAFVDDLIGDNAANFLEGGSGADELNGGAGNDTLVGGVGADDLIGGSGVDVADYFASPVGVSVNLATGAGSGAHAQGDILSGIENLRGTNSADVLTGNGLNNFLAGEGDADVIDGGDGVDTLNGDGGDDTLRGGAGNDRLFGSFGRDELRGEGDDDHIDAGGGDDTVYAGYGNDTAFGGSGDDYVTGGDGTDILDGENGNDTVIGGDGDDVVSGGAGFDSLVGNDGNDTLDGGNLEDTLRGQGDDDEMSGGNDEDSLAGGNGDDALNGDGGQDSLRGGGGNDTVNGGIGHDLVTGGNGNDYVDGGNGNDTVIGGGGADMVFGGAGNDSVTGGDGDDTLMGGNLDDTLRGGGGDDLMDGGNNDDLLYGGVGNDTLIGGDGDDTLSGSSGDDLFVFNADEGDDEINGFQAGAATDDVIDLSSFDGVFDVFADVLAAATDFGGDVVIDLGGGNSVTITNVASADLHEDDFLF